MKQYKLTADDLAENFNVPRRTVYHWVEKRGLPCIRLGVTIRFNAEDVEEWIKTQNEKGDEK